MKIAVRTALPSDAKPIARILNQLEWFAEFDRQSAGLREDRVKSFLRDALEATDQRVQVAVNPQGLVVGYLHCITIPYFFLPGLELYISQLFVESQHRAQGVGTQLLEAARLLADQMDACRIRLYTGANRDSHTQGFYSSRGFTLKDDAQYQLDLF